MTDVDIRNALKRRFFDPQHYAIAEEVGLHTGFSHRRLDMIVMDCWQSFGYRIDGFEIKISTSDLRRELQDPEKHIAFFDRIDYYTLAVPSGVVDPLIDIIPKKWGILIINEDGSSRYKRKPIALEDKKADGALPRGFVAGLIRKILEYQPSKEELRREFERGREAGQNDNKYLAERVKEKSDKIEAYDSLMNRLHTWSVESTENALAEFEAFRKCDLKSTAFHLDGCIEGLQKLKDYLSNTQKGEDQ